MTWKQLKTADDRERALKRYIERNSAEFHKYLTKGSLYIVFINANAEIDYFYIIKDDFFKIKDRLFVLKIPYIVVYKDFSNEFTSKALCLGDRKLFYEKN